MKNAHDLFQRGLLGVNTLLLALVAFLAVSTFNDFKEAVNTVNNLRTVPTVIKEMQGQMNAQAVELGVISSRLNYIERNQTNAQ